MSSILSQWLHSDSFQIHPRLLMPPSPQRPGITSHTPLHHTVGKTGTLSVWSYSSEAKISGAHPLIE